MLRILRNLRDFSISLLILLLSMILRLKFFMMYPPFRMDELFENFWSYLIVTSKGFIPLTNTVPFIGALYNYLAAVSYCILRSVIAFRLLVVITGALTVVATYFLALRLTGSRKAGILSSILLALIPPHILIASHVSWSASLTPLFVVLSAYTLIKTLESRGLKWWFLLGLIAGLTIQTHPSTIASLIGLILMTTYLYGIRTILKKLSTTAISSMVLGLTLGYINMIVYNIINPFYSLEFALQAKWTGLAGSLTVSEYFRRLTFIVAEFLTMLPSGIPVITMQYYLSKPLFYVFMILLTMLVIASLKSRVGKALGIYLITVFLILAVGTRGSMTFNIFGFAWGPHYLQQVIPMFTLQLCIGMLGVLRGFSNIKGRRLRLLTTIIFLVLTALTIFIWPLINMFAILTFMDMRGYTNEVFLNITYGLRRHYGDVPLYIVYRLPYRDSILMMIHVIAEMEGLDVYPRFNLKVATILKRAALGRDHSLGIEVAKIIDESNREFLEKFRSKNMVVLITYPKARLELLRMIKTLNLKIIYRHTVRVNSNPLYDVIIAKGIKTKLNTEINSFGKASMITNYSNS